ncbi:cation efflux family protein family, partial [Hortaea werneckii]
MPHTPHSSAHEHDHAAGLGINGNNSPAPSIRTDDDYDVHQGINESPSKDTEHVRSESASMLSPTRASFAKSPAYYTPITPQSAGSDGGFQSIDVPSAGATTAKNPFNFTTQTYTAAARGGASKSEALGRRKGHKYKHSSIHASHMDSIFQPPVPRTPLSVPSSLPMPTRKEAWWSMTTHQTLRLAWCACHFAVSAYVQFAGSGSLAMTALSRLLLFDAAGATVCVAVDVMGNFEVWKRSSIKHPFGLERADVLAGFGMAVFIAFMGLDIISHGVQHSLENLGSHESHNPHSH